MAIWGHLVVDKTPQRGFFRTVPICIYVWNSMHILVLLTYLVLGKEASYERHLFLVIS